MCRPTTTGPATRRTWTGDIKPDRAGPIALKAGDMDALLINLAIARDLAAGKPLTYRMVDEGRGQEPMTYRVVGKESVTVRRQELRGHQGLARRRQQGADRLDRAGVPGAGAHAAA